MKEAIIQYNDNPDTDGNHMVISWKELVRCKDCKHYDSFSQECRNGIDGIMIPNFYCGNAERKDGEV